METNIFCVYNLARRVFLSSKVTVADAVNEPLKVLRLLVSGLGAGGDTGLWLKPLHGTPTIPKLFPYDVAYLDEDLRVIEMVEVFPGAEFPPHRRELSSAVLLPPDSLRSTQTRIGDQLLVCPQEQVDALIAGRSRTGKDSQRLSPDHPMKRVANGVPTASAVIPEPVPSRVVAESRTAVRPGSSPLKAKPAAEISKPPLTANPIPLPQGALKAEEELAAETKAPSVSITEVVIEKPEVHTNVGHRAGLEDLFANWIDSPTAPPSWIAQKAREHAVENNPSESVVLKKEEFRDQHESLPRESAGGAETQSLESEGVKLPADRKPETVQSSSVAKVPTSAAAPTPTAPTPAAIPSAPPKTTFTIGQYGIWQVSKPTGAAPIASPKPSVSNSAPVNGKTPEPKRDAGENRESATAREATGDAVTPPVKANAQPNPIETNRNPSKEMMAPGKSASADFAATLQDKFDRLGKAPMATGAVSAEPISGPEKKPAADVKPAVVEVKPASPIKSAMGTPEPAAKAKPWGSAPQKPVVRAEEKKGSSVSARGIPANLPAPGFVKPKPDENGKRASAGRVQTNGKNGTEPQGLGARFKRWLNPATETKSDRRRANRRYVPGMVAHYYTGGAPKPHDVADISLSGMYVLTDDRWVPDTMIRMTLQKPCAQGERKQSITVLSRVVRRGSDGVATEFVMQESITSTSRDILPAQATDKFSLARFL